MGNGADLSPEDLFRGFSEGLAIWHCVQQVISTIGTASVAVTKSQLVFRRRSCLTYVWRPGRYGTAMSRRFCHLRYRTRSLPTVSNPSSIPRRTSGCTTSNFATLIRSMTRSADGFRTPTRAQADGAGASWSRISPRARASRRKVDTSGFVLGENIAATPAPTSSTTMCWS